ncbi:MAG: hypothetical protein ABJA74_02670 [Lapillicoccus sp.]
MLADAALAEGVAVAVPASGDPPEPARDTAKATTATRTSAAATAMPIIRRRPGAGRRVVSGMRVDSSGAATDTGALGVIPSNTWPSGALR